MSHGKNGWWNRRSRPPGAEGRPPSRALALAVALVVALAPATALATHLSGWSHDHSKKYIPWRPMGLSNMQKKFGGPCSDKANDAKTWFPRAVGPSQGGFVKYHIRLGLNVGYNIRTHIAKAHKNGAVDYGVYGYNCRYKTGGTSWSTHAYGIAIDTNTAKNPYGQSHWNGVGGDGERYYKYLPNLYKGGDPGHRFYWGINFSTPDPHHFQYVTGY